MFPHKSDGEESVILSDHSWSYTWLPGNGNEDYAEKNTNK